MEADQAEVIQEEKAGRRVRGDKVGPLREIKQALEGLLQKLGEFVGWAEYEDKQPWMPFRSFKTFQTADGQDWLLTWTTNGFKDRDGEIFETKAIEEYVARHEADAVKGEFQFWHIPGSKFGDIRWQGVSGRFLVEAGPFDETMVGQAFKEFFQAYPDGHPAISPEGWGASHGFQYRPEDRKGGVYRWFEKRETSVLPNSVAANPYNPELEVIQMLTEKQIQALEQIGGKDLVALVTETGEKRTEELEAAGIAFKAKKAGDFAEQIRAVADELEDEALAKQLKGLADKIAKALSKAKKPEEYGYAKPKKGSKAEGEEEGDTEEGEKQSLKQLAALLKGLAGRAKGEAGKKLMAIHDAMAKAMEEYGYPEPKKADEEDQEYEKPKAKKAADEPVTRGEMEGVVQVLGAGIANLTAEVKALSAAMGKEVRREVKETLEETPRISLVELAAKSVIGKEETLVDGRKAIAKDGPKETDPTQLPEGRVFGIPLLDALKAAGQRQPH
jgi:hypothetical protein